MHKIIILLSLTFSLYASNKYIVSYEDMTLGNIQDINTLKDGYLIAIPSNSFLKFILGFDKYIIYEKNSKPEVLGDTKYDLDKYNIIHIVNKLSQKREKKQIIKIKNETIIILCENNDCTYTRFHRKKNKTYNGEISFTKNNKLKSICDKQNNICIKQK